MMMIRFMDNQQIYRDVRLRCWRSGMPPAFPPSMEHAPMGWQSSRGGDWVPPEDEILILILDIVGRGCVR